MDNSQKYRVVQFQFHVLRRERAAGEDDWTEPVQISLLDAMKELGWLIPHQLHPMGMVEKMVRDSDRRN